MIPQIIVGNITRTEADGRKRRKMRLRVCFTKFNFKINKENNCYVNKGRNSLLDSEKK
jgi:hypothetical protein